MCETVILGSGRMDLGNPIVDDEKDFYGKQYYQKYVEKHGYPSIAQRARLDLPERCLHWLRTMLQFKLPPAKLLELGSAHGGFIALSEWSGYQSVGLEMSPWLVEFSKKTFGVNILTGPVESQQFTPMSFDVIVLFDVLEHFLDPLATMSHCVGLLKADGIIIIQTPRYPEGRSYHDLVSSNHDFPLHLKPEEHIYLFSENSIRGFFGRLGIYHIQFEPAIFANYDMFLVASRRPLIRIESETISENLQIRSNSRLVLALIDLADRKLGGGH